MEIALCVYFTRLRSFVQRLHSQAHPRLNRKEAADTTTRALERARMRKLQRAGFVLCIFLLAPPGLFPPCNKEETD